VKATGQFYDNSPAAIAIEKLATEKGKVVPMHQSSKRRFSIKRVAVAAMLAVGAWFGFSSDAGQHEKAPDMSKSTTNVVKIPVASRFAMPKSNDYVLNASIKQAPIREATPLLADYSLNAFIKQAPVQEKALKTIEVSAEQQELIPFYANRLAGFTSEKYAQNMVKEMTAQVQKGVIDMPQDVSVQKYLYAQEVYRRYGFKTIAKELGAALETSQKLSAEQQSKLFNYVRKAGKKGGGVQKMAQRMQRNNLWQVKASRGRAMV